MKIARLIASGLGTGYAPVAAGTVASAVAVVMGAGLYLLSPWLLALAAAAATIGGYYAIGAARVQGDPGWVVIDEYAGQWIAMLALSSMSAPGLLVAFALFRLFDIAKPGPVGWADRQQGAFGIMADDVIAGALAAALIVAGQWIFVTLM
jgi:phosphatidylglycerophosphatase A